MAAVGDIIDLKYPSTMESGMDFAVTITIRNVGSSAGSLGIRVRDIDTNQIITPTRWVATNKGAIYAIEHDLTMPDHEFHLRAEVWPIGGYSPDDTEDFTVYLPDEGSATIVGLDAPGSALAGSNVTVSILVRNNGGGDTLFAKLIDVSTGGEISPRASSFVAAGQEWNPSFNIVMPANSLTLRIEAGHEDSSMVGGPPA